MIVEQIQRLRSEAAGAAHALKALLAMKRDDT
jgi:hypothetical protein